MIIGLVLSQVAANNKGIGLVGDLIAEYGLPTVQAYMHHIQVSSPFFACVHLAALPAVLPDGQAHQLCNAAQANAEAAVRQMLVEFSEEQKLPEIGTVFAEDQMDDGTPIRVEYFLPWPLCSLRTRAAVSLASGQCTSPCVYRVRAARTAATLCR